MGTDGSSRNAYLAVYIVLILLGGLMVLLSIRDDVSIVVAAIGTAISAFSIFKAHGLGLFDF